MQSQPSLLIYPSKLPHHRVMVMLPGFGASQLSLTRYMDATTQNEDTVTVLVTYGLFFESFEDLGQQIWDMLSAFGYTSDIVLFGYSMGGFVAQTIAKQQPAGVIGLILVSTGTATHGSIPLTVKGRVLEMLKGVSNFTKTENSKMAMLFPKKLVMSPDEQHMSMTATRSGSVTSNVQMKSILQYMADSKNKSLSEQVTGITQPVLILHGSKDSVLDVKFAEKLRAALPQATLFVIEGSGHGMLFSKAAQVSTIINNWSTMFVKTNPTPILSVPSAHTYTFGYLG